MLVNRTRQRARFALAQRGLSLVELMVGIAVGLFVVAGAAMLVSIQLGDNRRLLLETQMQQDLRAASDIITRELRRAGHWDMAEKSVWTAAPGAVLEVNPYRAVEPDEGEATQVDFKYKPGGGGAVDFGFKRDGGVLKTLLGGAGWQELTDGNTLRITEFSVTPRKVSATMPCPNLCPDNSTACWPTLAVRELVIDITGQAVSDPAVRRSLRSVVRLRNDLVEFNVVGAPTQACPA